MSDAGNETPEADPADSTIRARVRALFDDTSSGPGRIIGWVIIALIVASCVSVAVETLPELPADARPWLRRFEYVAVGIFSLEYVLRIWSARRPIRKIFEPLVLIDLIAILPFYVGLLGGGLIDLRILRLLRTVRVLRMLKMQRYTDALSMLGSVVREARHKLLSFLIVAALCIVMMGSVMFYVEPETFRSIPHAIWWSVVTLTTVGYGETIPHSAVGRVLTSALMLLGIGIIAIPTGIISSGMVEHYHRSSSKCPECGLGGHLDDSRFCRGCGSRLVSG